MKKSPFKAMQPMKRLSLFLFMFATSLVCIAEPSIRIGSLTLTLAYAPPDSPVGLREYMLPGENVNTWTRMASVRVFKNEKNVRKYLNRVADQVIRSHPDAKAVLLKNEKTGESVLDFLTFTPDSRIAEWNLMRAKYDKAKKSLVVYQYAVRFRTSETKGSDIISERAKMTDAFNEATFQETAN